MIDRYPSERLQARARTLRSVFTAGIVVISALLLLERLGYAGAYRAPGLQPREAANQLLLSVPAIIYILALWQLRQAAAEVARGDMFGRVVVTALRRVGALLALGAAATLFVSPLLARLAGEPMTRLINADVATLVIAAIGLGLTFFASLLERAAGELEEFF